MASRFGRVLLAVDKARAAECGPICSWADPTQMTMCSAEPPRHVLEPRSLGSRTKTIGLLGEKLTFHLPDRFDLALPI